MTNKNAKVSSVDMSVPRGKVVRGYAIERMPIGRFLKATQMLEDAPEDVLKRLFPGAEAGDVLRQLKGLTKDGLQALFMRAMTVLPGYAVRLFAQLSGIDEDALLTDPNVGLDGLAEMAVAWAEVNGIENFTVAAGALLDKVRRMTGGFKS